ncbi:acyl-CoA/acyl-ACP dehydrogenase [Aneurinibacillus sp. Ricciae_BoGa-3]|uniref:acyl-CoA dehydrogenase family protein n=1 Tax=Aneurinibacillus sp. Ricciae_BoGa-3 TaxID=3022697 RepID=UPI00234022AF|nr:acyl-CoA dehydrogenase family protein [Aneurinibacillus sp. Ricciae_BoGa-3]WCK55060.1 acyl-CoA/acyl-ACP dehydrogenase [Aneurinibacillus sp. Ricciae_BoGa-3]
MDLPFNQADIENVLDEHLLPQVTSIDQEGLYPGDMLRILGDVGAFTLNNNDANDNLFHAIQLIESVGKRCATTAFVVWCHTVAVQLVAQCDNEYLKQKMLHGLTNGTIFGSTGLSNAMKSFAGMGPILLKGRETTSGYKVSGELPFVSNLGSNNWFAIVAETNDKNQVMAFVPCTISGLSLVERKNLLGMNGTATYACKFHEVMIPSEWIITQHARDYINQVRPEFVLKQAAILLGLIQASLRSIELFRNESEINQYLPVNLDDLKQKLKVIDEKLYRLAKNPYTLGEKMKDVFRLRLQSTYLAMQTTNAEMMHAGAAGYVKSSDPSRRYREAVFFGSITPTIKHLEKVLR